MNVNAHIHTPWSFSAFDSVDEALDMAAAGDVRVVGINDFNTTAGFAEWDSGCRSRGLFPLFGMEMIALDEDLQRAGVRVNDPANPGRTYLSGKGMAFPAHLPGPWAGRLAAVRAESDSQVRAMCGRLNELLKNVAPEVALLDADEITRTLTRGSLRERHLAKALRLAVYAAPDPAPTLKKLFGGREPLSPLADHAGVENEIRAHLLKAGGAAFVAETPAAFLPVAEVVALIEAAGGIPTYPFLGDDPDGNFTEFEADLPAAAAALKQNGIHSVEFIAPRNSAATLERYAGWLWDNGFTVTFGSEHNTPARQPIVLTTRGGAPLTPKLAELNYLGACVVAGHQKYFARNGDPYDPKLRADYAALGREAIKQRTDE